MRIAVAGFQHETNTFAPGPTGFDAFEMADSWPRLLTGDEVRTHTAGLSLPISGALAAAQGADIVPVMWCSAEPGGPVTDAAFDRIAGEICDGLAAAGPLDGVYLDLHGAMVTEAHEDGEGALLHRVRAVVGPDLPIGVSLDLHANLSPAMVDPASVVTIHRTYPHLDMADTGARCMRRLITTIRGQPCFTAFRQADYLVPLHAQYTGQAPADALYDLARQLSTQDGEAVNLALGFTAADIVDCGPSIVAHATTQDRAEALANRMADALRDAALAFDTTLPDMADAVRQAVGMKADRPVVIADVQDNPGAGGTADTTGLLHALIDQLVRDAVVGVLCDPGFAARAHAAGPGAVFDGDLGAVSRLAGHRPVQGRFRVLALSDGKIPYTGEMYAGGTAEMGPSALVAIEGTGVRVVVSSVRVQCLDQALFRHFGVVLETAQIIGVKSTVHYRADFDPLAAACLSGAAPGAFSCRPRRADYTRLRPGVRVG
jgi:microcystin degradation protein MlrC